MGFFSDGFPFFLTEGSDIVMLWLQLCSFGTKLCKLFIYPNLMKEYYNYNFVDNK